MHNHVADQAHWGRSLFWYSSSAPTAAIVRCRTRTASELAFGPSRTSLNGPGGGAARHYSRCLQSVIDASTPLESAIQEV